MTEAEATLGRYRLLRLLGQGGVGTVHLGCSHGAAGFEKLVALKLLKPELTEDPNQARYLQDEARIGVELEHQNIVQVLDLGEEAGRYFVVMEYIRGFSLAKVLSFLQRSEHRMPLPLVAHVFRKVSRAVEYVHSQLALDGQSPLFHGDVSAANILLGASGRIALGDFGVAALMHHRPGQLAGKWSYVPHEALLGARVDHSWDLFALGALLYELVTGTKAFGSDSFASRSACDEVPAEPDELRDDLPSGLSGLMLEFLASAPSDRPSNAKEMRRALNRFVPPQGEEEDIYESWIDSVFEHDDFVGSYGTLPSTSSLRNPVDPFMEETEAATVRVRFNKPLRFGLSLAHGAERAKGYGEKLALVLSQAINRPLRPVLLGDYQTLVDCLLRGDIDIAWMPPRLMNQAAACGAGLVVVAERNGQKNYRGSLFVRKDSGIKSLEDVRGKGIAWVDKDSASGYAYPLRIVTEELGPTDAVLAQENYMGSHLAVCEAVAKGWIPVGGSYVVLDEDGEVSSTAWGDLLPERADELELLAVSAPIPADCIGHRPNFSEEWFKDVQRAFVHLHESPEGAELLEAAFRAQRFVRGNIEDYEFDS